MCSGTGLIYIWQLASSPLIFSHLFYASQLANFPPEKSFLSSVSTFLVLHCCDLMKSRVCMFDDTPLAMSLHQPIAIQSDPVHLPI